MYSTITEFIEEWKTEGDATQKLFDALTDSSLGQQVSPNDRTLGGVAWHIVETIPYSFFGISEIASDSGTIPTTAKEIAEMFRNVRYAVLNTVSKLWSDASLKEDRKLFGMNMPTEVSLQLIIKHLIHHRGQMTVLMRQAGLQVSGVYGPSREEWASTGMEAPKVQ
ncbi:DinB family protein [Paenibacillus illinoisensis]|uniref:DinB family protein n=1 Tax=Paenibacillus illinoisensis TaxID=59845 RepID=UPI001C8E6B6A|nr:DinB family protein [Paenibacillus illinoisensis]MBY0217802.1 DinB family protein [Paenibacillus illinoisensis]